MIWIGGFGGSGEREGNVAFATVNLQCVGRHFGLLWLWVDGICREDRVLFPHWHMHRQRMLVIVLW